MEALQKEIKRALEERAGGRREDRQAKVLKIVREMTAHVFRQFLAGEISEKQMGECIRRGEADLQLILHWRRSEKQGRSERVCCLLCVRKGRRCICRRVSGTECSNCLCTGECRNRCPQEDHKPRNE
ncbi:bud site selection protein 31 [Nematocida major]|uniref:bud site selection protein 31 n=1 Tax=Nematocida major TaxID=1912982 RepID=UPI00200789AA|nr:bud site selection protein 31 [Nematocida major]KAH9387484.1 bud site selection protein 31 [Nematocida major]